MTCLRISYTDSARYLVDEFERSLNASYAATPRTPIEFYLGMHVQRDRKKRVLSIDVRRHIYDFIRSMELDPLSSASVSTPLDPHITYSKADCPPEIDAEIKERQNKPVLSTYHSTRVHAWYLRIDVGFVASRCYSSSTTHTATQPFIKIRRHRTRLRTEHIALAHFIDYILLACLPDPPPTFPHPVPAQAFFPIFYPANWELTAQYLITTSQASPHTQSSDSAGTPRDAPPPATSVP